MSRTLREIIDLLAWWLLFALFFTAPAKGQPVSWPTTRPTTQAADMLLDHEAQLADVERRLLELERWRKASAIIADPDHPRPSTLPATLPTTIPATKPALTLHIAPNLPNTPDGKEQWTEAFRMFGQGEVTENWLIVADTRVTGVLVAGTGNRVRNLEVKGGPQAIVVRGGANATVDGVRVTKAQYGVFVEGDSRGVTLTNLDLDASGGMHAIRIYKSRDVFIRDSRLLHNGPYPGACLNVRQGLNVTLSNLTTGGLANGDGFGPDPTNPAEATWALDGLVIDSCTLSVVRTVQFYPRCNGALVKNTTIKQTSPTQTCVNVHPGASVVFEGCAFEGGNAVGNGTFRNCTWNGQALTTHP